MQGSLLMNSGLSPCVVVLRVSTVWRQSRWGDVLNN